MNSASTIEKPTSDTPAHDVAKVAGRGTVYITAAKLWFMVSGAAIHFTLPRLMRDDQFGLYQIVVNIVSIVNAVIITGTYQSVSKHVSERPEIAGSVKATALRVQMLVGGCSSLGFFLLAPVIANYLHDPRLIPYFRLAALIPLSYSFYAVFTGYFNGRREFLTQAALDVTYSTLKFVLIVLLVWLGYGVGGAVSGFVLAAACVLGISALAAGKGEGEGNVRAGDLLKFQGILFLFTFVLSLLQKVDLILIKALSSSDAIEASRNAAYYSASAAIANLTYQMIISVTFVIFPLISHATFVSERARTRLYITNTVRYTLMMMALAATLFSANASEVLNVVYPQQYQAGTAALSILALGMLLFGLVTVMTTIISASGRPAVSLFVGCVTLATSAGLNAVLIPRYGLRGAAVSTTAAMLVGALAGGAYLWRRFGPLVPALSALRIAGCSALVYSISVVVSPASRMLIIAQLVGASLIYVAGLVVSREIGPQEVIALKQVIGLKGKAAAGPTPG